MQKPGRTPHWRCNGKQAERAAATFRRAAMLKVYRAAARLVSTLRPIRAGVYEVTPATVLELRHRLDDAAPYATDEEGIW